MRQKKDNAAAFSCLILTSVFNILRSEQMPRLYKSRTSAKKATSRAMVMYRQPRDIDIFKPLTTKLVYSDTILLTSTGAIAFTTHAFRANSVFDPDWTGGGHQPTRYDQFAALYQRYEVLKSNIRVQFCTGEVSPTSTTVATGPWTVGVVCSANATPAGLGTDPGYTLAESPRSDFGALTTNTVRTCNTYWDRTLNGVVKHDDSLTAAVGNNPSSEGYYILWAFNEGNVAATTVLAHVRIEFHVRFTRPVQPQVS